MRAVAAAASSLQYCSVGSLMADVRQCCFPPGGGGEGGGGLHILSGCGDLEAVPCFGVTVSIRTLGRDEVGGGAHLSCVVYHLMTQM